MNALQLAIQRKENAIAHYKKTVEDCGHPSGKKMFQVVLADEVQHLKVLKNMLSHVDEDFSDLGDVEVLADIMERMRLNTRVADVCSLDDMDVFKVAMEMEREDYEFYKELAVMAAINEEKALFEKLAHEEEKQYKVISETHSFLSDTGNWFMWEEHSIAEG